MIRQLRSGARFNSTAKLVNDVLILAQVQNLSISIDAYADEQTTAKTIMAVDGINLAFSEYPYYLPNFQSVNYFPQDIINDDRNFYSMLPTTQPRYSDVNQGFYSIESIQCYLIGGTTKTMQFSITNNIQEFFDVARYANNYSSTPDIMAYNTNDRTLYIYPVVQTTYANQYVFTGTIFMPTVIAGIDSDDKIIYTPEEIPYALDAVDFLQLIKYRAAIYVAEQSSESREKRMHLQQDFNLYQAKCEERRNQRLAQSAARRAQSSRHGGYNKAASELSNFVSYCPNLKGFFYG